ncbi:MAG: hypothetical protein WCP20_19365 [Desulfuromonadales bacterium]
MIHVPPFFPAERSHEILANKNGLFIKNIQAEKIELEPGYTLSALAPWVFLKDKWQVRGDFSLPPLKDRNAFLSGRAYPDSAKKSGIIH